MPAELFLSPEDENILDGIWERLSNSNRGTLKPVNRLKPPPAKLASKPAPPVKPINRLTDPTKNRLSLIAEILVALFGDAAVGVALGLVDGKGDKPPARKEKKSNIRYEPTPPGPGWVRIAPGPRGGVRWMLANPGAAAVPATAGIASGGPNVIPAGVGPNDAFDAAMAAISGGQSLSDDDKQLLATHLPALGRNQLKALHAALGAGGVFGLKAQIVNKVHAVLTRGWPRPRPRPRRQNRKAMRLPYNS